MSPEALASIAVTVLVAVAGGMFAALRHSEKRTDARLSEFDDRLDALQTQVSGRLAEMTDQANTRHGRIMDALQAINLKVAETYFPSAQAERLEARIMRGLDELKAEVRGLRRRREDDKDGT
ncbi:hypothetical protein [Zavarzinia sp. CC-PAN008]|uniref:hypothetical protein n=1 Tax=Zavarzinia sp. CC-PAN008 TaxID=3243332 RepID=UPI003F7431D7